MKKILLFLFSVIGKILSSFWLMVLLLLACLCLYNFALSDYMQSISAEVNGMVWGTGKQTITAQVTELPPEADLPEQQFFLLKLYNADNQTIFSKQLVIDWDMFGAGFLKAMQVDDDSEPEIVFYTGRHVVLSEENRQRFFDDNESPPVSFNFYLDIMPTCAVEIKDFDQQATPAIRNAAYHIKSMLNPVNSVLLFILCLPVIIIIKILSWIVRRCFARKSEQQQDIGA